MDVAIYFIIYKQLAYIVLSRPTSINLKSSFGVKETYRMAKNITHL